MAPDSPTNAVQSDENLLAILRTIREDDLHGVTELADELGMAKSSVHGHLATLESHGFLTRTDGRYYVGFRFLDYGTFARNRHPLFQAAKQSVDELAAETNERAWCVIEDNDEAVYLYGASGRRAIQTHERIGEHTTLHDIAAGKAILAFLPDERIDEVLSTTSLVAKTPHTITDKEDLRDELQEIRDRGIAFNFEESMEGVHAAGAPIRRIDDGVYGSISVGGPANRMTKERLRGDIADMLLGMANEIEVNIRHQ